MSTITIELPDIVQQSLAEKQELSRFVLEAIALEGYRQEALSRGQVGAMLGMNFGATEAFLKERNAYLHYDMQDFEQDMATSRRLGQKGKSLIH